jgi:hypothetical protein
MTLRKSEDFAIFLVAGRTVNRYTIHTLQSLLSPGPSAQADSVEITSTSRVYKALSKQRHNS